MRILMTTDNIGGVWTFSTDLAKGLKQMEVDVTLVITGNPLTASQREEIRGTPFYFAPFRQEWMDEPWKDIERAGKWLMEIAAQVRPHVVHLNSYSWGVLDWKCPVVMTVHSCVLSWWQGVRRSSAPECWNTYREKVARGMAAAAMLTAPSSSMLAAAEQFYGPFERRRIIYNGRDPLCFPAGKKEKIVFSMGRLWDEAKNISLLIRAARKISYPVYVAGQKGSIPDKIPSNVHFTGFLGHEGIARWLSKAAVYALPVRYEPFGYTFLEAAFSGCALIGGDVPTLREIWKDAMVYVDPDNPAALAESVTELMEQGDKRAYLAKAARHRAARYTRDAMVGAYRELYREVRLFGRAKINLGNRIDSE